MVPFFCFKAKICCRKGKDRSCMDTCFPDPTMRPYKENYEGDFEYILPLSNFFQ